MQEPRPTIQPFFAGRGSTEPSPERTKSAGDKRGREAQSHAPKTAPRRDAVQVDADLLPVAQGGPLVAGKQTCFHDRDIGVRRATRDDVTTRRSPAVTQQPHAAACPPDQQVQAAHRVGPLHLQMRSGYDGMENLPGNRFGGDEVCRMCGELHSDSNYVATDAYGFSYCGDCWDAALGATIIVQCVAFPPGKHHCACGADLRSERWLAVDDTPSAVAYCQSCCLKFWGFKEADMIVSAIEDSRMHRLEQGRGAHLHSSSLTTPNDDTSPMVGLSDRGFYTGQVLDFLEGCMNLSPPPGVLELPAVCAHEGHTHISPRVARTHGTPQHARAASPLLRGGDARACCAQPQGTPTGSQGAPTGDCAPTGAGRAYGQPQDEASRRVRAYGRGASAR